MPLWEEERDRAVLGTPWAGLDGNYSRQNNQMAEWLMTLRNPDGMKGKELTALKRRAMEVLCTSSPAVQERPKRTAASPRGR